MSNWEARMRLYLYVYLRKIGLPNAIFIGIILTSLFVMKGVGLASAKILNANTLAVSQLELALSKTSMPSDETKAPSDALNLRKFEELLGDRKYVEQEVKRILEIANKSGVLITTGDYKMSDNETGQFSTYSVNFPVRGTYQQIRNFVEKCLLLIPNASLDEMRFKRDLVGQSMLESKIQLSIYYRSDASVSRKEIFE